MLDEPSECCAAPQGIDTVAFSSAASVSVTWTMNSTVHSPASVNVTVPLKWFGPSGTTVPGAGGMPADGNDTRTANPAMGVIEPPGGVSSTCISLLPTRPGVCGERGAGR